MDRLLKKLKIDETFTKEVHKEKSFNKIKNNVPPKEDYNFMADLLTLPQTKQKYKYLFVIVDLYTREFDCEPMRNKTPEDALIAMKKCFKRNYVNKPYATIKTDSGTEFKGVFHKWLVDKDIMHKTSIANRHKSLSMVESLNKQLGRLINGYLNAKEEETGKEFIEWVEILPLIRKELNKFRKENTELLKIKDYPTFSPGKKDPKFKVGDIVHNKLDIPRDALNNNIKNANSFRAGDFRFAKDAKKIKRVVYMSDEPYYRYILEGIKNVSYSASELRKSKDTEAKFKVKKLIGKKRIRNITHYKVWFEKELKKDAIWLPAGQLIEDGFQDEIDEYNN